MAPTNERADLMIVVAPALESPGAVSIFYNGRYLWARCVDEMSIDRPRRKKSRPRARKEFRYRTRPSPHLLNGH